MQRFFSILIIVLLCMTAAIGCSHPVAAAPVKIVVVSGTHVVGKTLTACLLTWDVQHGAMTLSDKPLFRRFYYDDWPTLRWSPGPPFTVLQQFVDQKAGNATEKRLFMLQALSPDVSLLQLPRALGGGNIYAQGNVSWYAWDNNVFMSSPAERTIRTSADKVIEITQYNTPARTVDVSLPSDAGSLQQYFVLYGSGSLSNGFLLLEFSTKGATSDTLWLVRLADAESTWFSCGEPLCGGLVSGISPQFVHIGTHLYILGGCRDKIAMIDTAADNPVITYPKGINRTFSSLIAEGAKNVTGDVPFSPMLEDGGTLLLLQPFAVGATYALREDGTILGSLQQDAGGKLWCANSHDKKLSSLALPNLQYLSFPSPDLFVGL